MNSSVLLNCFALDWLRRVVQNHARAAASNTIMTDAANLNVPQSGYFNETVLANHSVTMDR